MKKTLAILVAGLFLLTTPMLALAYGNDHHDRGANHYSGWVKDHPDARHGNWKDGRKHRQPYRFDRHRYDRYRYDRHHHYDRRGYAVVTPLPILLPPRVLINIGW